MMPSWLPQNIQKRVFKYILSRLEVFSNIDTENLDVSIGATQTQLSLKDVKLDTKKITTLPGVSIRDGNIGTLNLKLAVLGSVRIEGSGLSLTVSLTNEILNDKDEFNSFLAKTTADLASSILISEPNSNDSNTITKTELVDSISGSFAGSESFAEGSSILSEEAANGGYGAGDFSGLINRIADSALSQLNVVFRDIKLQIVLVDTIIDLLVGTFKMSTNESGTRQVSVYDMECILVSSAPHSKELQPFYDNDMLSSIYQPNEVDEYSSMTQSMFFSTSNSMYMSAMSEGLENTQSAQEETKPRLLWCEGFTFAFSGLDFATSDIVFKTISISLKDIPPVLTSVADFLFSQNLKRTKEGKSKTSGSVSKNDSEQAKKKTNYLKIEKIEVSLFSSLLPHGLFENNSGVSLVAQNIEVDIHPNADIFFEIQQFTLAKPNKALLKFDRDRDPKIPKNLCDFSCIVTKDFHGQKKIEFSFPYKCDINFDLDDISMFVELFQTFQKAISPFSSNPAPNLANFDEESLQPFLIGKTNVFEISITLGKHAIRSVVHPLTFHLESSLSVPKISFFIDGTKVLDIEKLIFRYMNGKPMNTSIDHFKAIVDIDNLNSVKEELLSKQESLRRHERGAFHNNERQIDTNPSHKAIQKVIHSLKIRSISLNILLPAKLKNIDAHFEEVIAHTTEANNSVVSVQSFNISRDMSDVDSRLGYLDLIHSIHETTIKKKPVIEIKIKSNGHPRKITVRDLVFDYHSRLLELFGSSTTSAATENLEPKVNELLSSDKQAKKLDIPIYLNDCVVGLSPFHIPSHGVLLLNTSKANIHFGASGEIDLTLDLVSSSLYTLDDIKPQYLVKQVDSKTTSQKFKYKNPNESIGDSLKGCGYTNVATINEVFVEVSVLPKASKHCLSVDAQVKKIYLHTCADSTFHLIQLVNDLKPPLDLAPFDDRFKVHIGKDINTFENVENDFFSSENRHLHFGLFEANADFVHDDLPTNLEFVESYYAERNSKPQWSSSSGSLSMNYSNTDIHLEEDLNEMITRESANRSSQVVEFGEQSTKKVSVFEQKASSHEPAISFTEDHFGKRDADSTGFSNNERPTEDIRLLKNDNDHSTFSEKLFDSNSSLRDDSLTVKFSISSVIWDLYDGFDWSYTREMITNAVFQVEEGIGEVINDKEKEVRFENIQPKSSDPHQKSNQSLTEHDDLQANSETEEVVGGLLFNSIFIGMSTHQDSLDLRKRINNDIQDLSESEIGQNSFDIPDDASSHSSNPKRQHNLTPLKLKRSKAQKLRISLQGITGSISIYAGINDPLSQKPLDYSEFGGDGAIILNTIALKVKDIEILDNVQTSTWNKFLTYLRSAGERETGASMLNLELKLVKPVPSIPTSELVMSVQVLPLRLHVDQDTLDFVTRFFEFKDDRFERFISHLPVEIPFVQRFDIKDIPVKLDYKPKKVDYSGLRSGRTTEFMNFFILDEAEMVLRHITLHGINGFPTLGQKLNDIWMPDIRTNQLGDVLSGLAPVRSLVKIGSGIKDLVAVPIQEYRKDGRVMRSIQKGAWVFAKNTSNELVKFGAKLAVGTQTVLENAEQVMGGTGSAGRTGEVSKSPNSKASKTNRNFYRPEEAELGESYMTGNTKNRESGKKAAVSLYADQPQGVKQGIKSAYSSMGRNLSIARGAVADIKTDAVKSGSVQGAAKAVVKAAPIALIRPMIGVTEAVSKTLLGVTNQMDPKQLEDMEEKYRNNKK